MKTVVKLGLGAALALGMGGMGWKLGAKPAGAVAIADLPRAVEAPLVTTPLPPGVLAPDFVLPDQSGKKHRLSELRGHNVVLSFYPQDFTYMCSISAVSLTRELPRFHASGTKVFGVSVQNGMSKQRFASDYGIKIPLLADTSKFTAASYGVLNKDGLAGRVTFVIGPDGRIVSTDAKVQAETHGADVLKRLDALGSGQGLLATLQQQKQSFVAPLQSIPDSKVHWLPKAQQQEPIFFSR